ncbi:VanZ family protein [Streptomyces sp. ST2-7A]|uniref:VanZ family protein n=1 Tax=Streptomyces sp. ST2-7A TaxID=2907214 RepID=UPI001F226A8B|nr:VanZ family protein [Streptomyces sp. ST2-7A]MCE7082405.1 VanZ family protein [Streptomyces sp. ST2-7A]
MNDFDLSFRIDPAVGLGPLLVAFAVLVAVRAARNRPGWTGRHAATRLMAAGYAAAVASITIFPIVATYGMYANQVAWYNMLNPIPVLTVDFTFLPNMIMFLPLGVLLPLLSRRARSVGRATLLCALTSLTIETAQCLSYIMFNNGRSVDVNDLLANTLGGLLGHLTLRGALRVSFIADTLRTLALPGSALAPERTPTAPVAA